MKDRDDRIMRTNVEFVKELEEIQKGRVMNGKDKPHKEKSKARLTLGIKRHKFWETMKKDLIDAELTDTRGASTDLFIWIIVGFIALLIFGAWMYAMRLLNTTLSSIPAAGALNFTEIAAATTGQYVTGIENLKWIAFGMFIAYAISLFISSYFSKGNPVYFAVNILIIGIAIVVSVYLSNAYETLLVNPLLGATYSEFTGMNFFMAYLPYIVGAVGLFNLIFLFGAILKNSGGTTIG